MHPHKSLLINAFKHSLIICLFKGHKFLLYCNLFLPYLGEMPQIVQTRITKTMNKHMGSSKLRVTRNFFQFKDFVPETLRSSLIYKFSCGSCTASCIGKTYGHFKIGVSEHQGVSPGTGKPINGILLTSVRDHMLVCDHKVIHEDLKFLGN